MKKVIYIVVCVFALFGCSGFLEEYSQDKAYIRSYEDLDELLLGNAYFVRYQTRNSWQFSGVSGDLYYPWIHVLADELCQQTGGFSWVAGGACGSIYGYYTWQYRVYENVEGKQVWDDGADFRHLYSHINACNMILEETKAFEEMTEEEDVQNVNRIKGECHFLRGCYYFLLANFYGKPYVASTAESDPAVPIKTSNYVEDKYYSRNSVAEVYKQIVTDLLDAEKFLKDVPKKSMWRADINAVRLMLSRVYLYMCLYEEAEKYAALVTENGPQLEDLNSFSGKKFLSTNLSELIFSTGASSLPGNVTFYSRNDGTEPGFVSGNDMRISNELYEAYNPRNPIDLRLQYFVLDYDGSIRYRKLQGETFQTTDLSDVFLMRTAEAWLNLAEAAACAGDEPTARKALNTLREKRIKREFFDESEVNGLTGENLVQFIREERRRELCLEGHRWFDLRRYRVAEKYPQEVTVEHVYVNKTYNSSTYEYETLWIRKFVLTTDDPAWVMPLPKAEIDKNTGMLDNPRNERGYEDVNN